MCTQKKIRPRLQKKIFWPLKIGYFGKNRDFPVQMGEHIFAYYGVCVWDRPQQPRYILLPEIWCTFWWNPNVRGPYPNVRGGTALNALLSPQYGCQTRRNEIINRIKVKGDVGMVHPNTRGARKTGFSPNSCETPLLWVSNDEEWNFKSN